ncbi:unnamed protein product [Arabis nemorensis]|uniref:Uncharacterized protein n=1 Tax=Arabis nemorensis TaxID=586526 RepID=A0A565AMV2_9BRAS|nr:unnamed protein product [Arabis nemorensis]
MDRQKEEETGDGERSIESSIGKFIPLDLIPDILLKLPAKSAVRFRCFSKLWSSITTPPDFIRSFAIQSSTRLRLMVCVKTSYTRLFITLPQHVHPDTSYSPVVDRYEIKSPPLDYYHSPFSEPVQSLVCYGDDHNIVVWNPSMRQNVTLPEPGPRVKYISSCLGYDPVEGKYKVLCISGYKCNYPLVFTLGPQESWRLTNNCPLHQPTNSEGRIGVCVNGHVYYEAKILLDDDPLEYEHLLMSFHVRYETFNTIKKPADPTLDRLLLNYQGKLAWVCYSVSSLRF